MQKISVKFTTLTFVLAAFLSGANAFAGDIEWGGLYRIEGYNIQNSEMRSSNKKHLDYGLSHLILNPKITAGDGLTVYSRFDIFNSSKYPNSQMGQIWGNGVGSSTTNAPSNTLSNSMASDTIAVNELYLTYTHEFGQLVVGRVPLQFGLGMTYNAGHGLFDHWFSNRDLVGYKVILGNFWFLPMIGKPTGGDINESNDLDDYMIQAEYENPETDMSMGIFFEWRKGGDQAADGPVGVGSTANGGAYQELGGNGASNSHGTWNNSTSSYTACTTGHCSSSVDMKTINLYALKDTERYRLGMEASFSSGNLGVHDGAGNQISVSGFGIAAEFEYRPQASTFKYGLRAGYASGDDFNSTTKYEGYQFNRNYDVAMLLFNHPLGQADFLRSGAVTGNVYKNNTSTDIGTADVETISNTIYFAPKLTYGIAEHWSMDHTIATGWLATNAVQGQGGKSLGFEYDLDFAFTPRKGVQWITQAGLLFPGQAWKGDGSLSNNFAFGLGTKAAISF